VAKQVGPLDAQTIEAHLRKARSRTQ
jgi:hypothetical protein